ncbi:PAS domain-containing sensor histidine kinase [Flavisolibacter nicotianae]|uniref:PAS domain-containing sensor histidine kinase n=1 Tax=Flavisolibacter nicotianae TaxID=2364882 RepID=UPI0013C4B431|nr:PAS domain S-box protein [Flavisolibacter nicotianae]
MRTPGFFDELNFYQHLQNTPLGIVGLTPSLEISYWSDGAAGIFEWEETDVLHQPISQLHFVFEEDREKVHQKFAEILDGTISSNRCTNRNYTKSGRVIYCEWYNSALKDTSGKVTSLLCFVYETTHLNKIVQKLEHSQGQLSLIYNSAIDPMWLISIEDGERFRFESINTAFTDVTGLKAEQVVGNVIEDVLPVTSHQLVREKYTEAMQSGKIVDYIEIAVHPAGKRVGEIRVIPVKDKAGRITKIVGIAHDITEKVALQKKLDEERDLLNKRLTAAAIKSQELERNTLGWELHDNVNQVLTTAKLYTELCAARVVDLDVYLPKCTAILNDTINEIRRISKHLAAPSFGTVEIAEAMKDLAESVRLTQKLELELELPPHCNDAIDEDLQLATYRIAQEQLTNVLKHSQASHVLVRLTCTANALTLVISDNGIGFDPKQKANGIGITNMINRTNLFNGEFLLESEPGKGCTVTVRFPVNENHGRYTSIIKETVNRQENA